MTMRHCADYRDATGVIGVFLGWPYNSTMWKCLGQVSFSQRHNTFSARLPPSAWT